jgi:hypothetical protein
VGYQWEKNQTISLILAPCVGKEQVTSYFLRKWKSFSPLFSLSLPLFFFLFDYRKNIKAA